ncbi:MAG: nucleotidyltransferase family protein [Acetatifactor sp.]|nr:nucleotidyltransferase family protein [Acetatifactor sp.]
MNDISRDLIYLLSCAVNEVTPDAARVQAMDLEKVWEFAKFHMVTGATCIALERAGVKRKEFHEALSKAVRKNICFDLERQAIFDAFEEWGIWYLPMKGIILKELYPENGMRQMSDNDVLCDADKMEEVRKIMLARGYTKKGAGKGNHDVYLKAPMLNFEMHRSLFATRHAKVFRDYYADVKRLMIKDENRGYEYRLSDEDFYVYFTVHERKHKDFSGIGIRTLLDRYVFLKEKGDSLDWNYVEEQESLLEIKEFEIERRKLAMNLFSGETVPELAAEDEIILTEYLGAGANGNMDLLIQKKLEKMSKPRFVLECFFPKMEYMKRSVPFVDKWPWLYPAGVVFRWGRILIKRKGIVSRVLRALNKKQNDKKV